MKSYLSLAWKELKAQKVTSVLILLAVILSTVATTVMGQSVGILQTMRREQAAGLNGDRYATFHQLTREQSEVLYEDARLKDVGTWINVGDLELENSSLTLFLREYYGDALLAYPSMCRVKEGRLPATAGEIALSEETLKYLGLEKKTGEKISLPLEVGLLIDDQPKYEYTADFVLTGILENDYLGYSSGMLSGIVGEGTAESLLPERYLSYSTDFKTVGKKEFQAVTEELRNRLGIQERQVQYNWVLLDAMGIDYPDKQGDIRTEGFPFMMAACIMVGALILLAAGLVIYNILKVAVMKRIREYGTLRAIGGGSGQLYALVTVQIMLLSVIGLLPGMLLGVLLTKGILTAVTGMLNPELFMADTTEQLNARIAGSGAGGALPLLVSVVVTLLFAMLAAYPSAVYAARVSPTVAMSGQQARVKRRRRKVGKIRNFEAFYARLNLRRNRGRTVITILSMVMSITVFVALQSFSSLLDAGSGVRAIHTGDYSVGGSAAAITPEEAAKMERRDEVETLSTTKLTVYESDETGKMPIESDLSLQPGETFQIAALDEARITGYELQTTLTEEDLEAIMRGEACLVMNPLAISFEGQEVPRTELHKGDTIIINGRKVRVAGVTTAPVSVNNDGFTNGVQVIGVDALYDALVGDNKYAELYPTLKEEADPEVFEAWLDGWCIDNPGIHWLSYRQLDAQTEESFEQIRLLCWGLILFIGLIGILNIINTVYTNIHTRVNEIGMQRAIGMSNGSLYKTFLWEGAYYGLIASAIGSVCGYVCTIFVEAARNDSLRLGAFPAVPVLEAAVVSVAACLIATAVPLRGIGKMSVVESIESVE